MDWLSREKRMLNIEITNKCRVKCLACIRHTNPKLLKTRYEIPFEQLKPVFDYFDRVLFCGQMSDPIYHKEFLKILEYLAQKADGYNKKIYKICTNGHGMSEDFWQTAFNLTKDKSFIWRFGVDGLPKDTHKYRVGQDGLKVFEFMKLGKTFGCNIEWQYIVFNYNENDIEEAQNLAYKHDIKFIETHSNRFALDTVKHLTPSERFIA